MSRWSLTLVLILLLPALALIVWLAAAQLPLWTAPQAGWFAPETPGVCAAVESLALYQAVRSDPNGGIGREAAKTDAAQVVAAHYDTPAPGLSDPLAVDATLPSAPRGAYFVVTARLSSSAVAVLYLDAATGDPRALITATEDPAQDCAFDVKAALLAALKSPPLLLLAAYLLIAAGALAARYIKGRYR